VTSNLCLAKNQGLGKSNAYLFSCLDLSRPPTDFSVGFPQIELRRKSRTFTHENNDLAHKTPLAPMGPYVPTCTALIPKASSSWCLVTSKSISKHTRINSAILFTSSDHNLSIQHRIQLGGAIGIHRDNGARL
jgi:hypothetical protein